jgi:Domain of unknown function (DUF4157)
MTHEREHETAKPRTVDDFEVGRPGRASTCASLSRPTFPVASGILMRKGDGVRDANGVAEDAGAQVDAASRSSGSTLPDPVMRKFESSLGTDLSSVRVHTGGESAAAASAVGARAYAVGQDIHFGTGQYDPSSNSGQHLLAHEVAHTVQQRGGNPIRQNKLAVSGPQDSLEHEADRAADAMVSGAPAMISSAPQAVARTSETDGAADEGEKAMANGDAKTDLTLQVSNAQDVQDAQRILGLLDRNQLMLEKGAAMVSPEQRRPGELVENMTHGKSNKLLTQIPLEAVGQNAAVISDLNLYIVQAGGQATSTNDFQDQYRMLVGNYGRLEGIAKTYTGTSLKTMQPKDAAGVVSDAVSSGGHDPAELKSTFQTLMKDPNVRGAREKVESSTQELEKMPSKLSDAESASVSSMKAFNGNIVSATIAEKGANSLALRNAFQAAKAKSEESKKFTEEATKILTSGGKDAVKTAAKAVVGAGALTASKFGKIASEGLASGGEAIAMDLANKLVIEPAQEMLGHAIESANAAVGIIDEKAQVDANLDAEQAKQDSATIEAFKAGKASLADSGKSAKANMAIWVKAAVEFEAKKLAVKANFSELEAAIKTAANAKGKGAQGKALAEMTGFLHEAEQFVVQANACIDIAHKGLGTGSKDQETVIAKARDALAKVNSRQVWMVHSYPFKKAGGETVEYYGAQQVELKVKGQALDGSAADQAGKGRADGFSVDPSKNGHSSNQVITDVVPQMEGMRDKVLAIRTQLMSQVFGAGE